MIAALGAALGPDPVTATAGKLVFFDLGPTNDRVFAGMPAGVRERRRLEALERPLVHWLDGFFPPEEGPVGTFRWCDGDCIMEIDNGSGREARVELSMLVGAAWEPASLHVTGDIWSEVIPLARAGTPISRTLHVPVGRYRLRLRSDGKPVGAPQDPRRLVFRVDDAHLRLTADPSP
jgi:hypothetical protein